MVINKWCKSPGGRTKQGKASQTADAEIHWFNTVAEPRSRTSHADNMMVYLNCSSWTCRADKALMVAGTEASELFPPGRLVQLHSWLPAGSVPSSAILLLINILDPQCYSIVIYWISVVIFSEAKHRTYMGVNWFNNALG